MRPLFLITLLFYFTPVFAVDDIRLYTINWSSHFTEKQQNESHNGIGIEYKVKSGHFLGAGRYINSLGNKSNLLSYTIENDLYRDIDYSCTAGYVTGYQEINIMAGCGVVYGFTRLMITPRAVVLGFVID